MKIVIKENIQYKDVKKYLPQCYAALLPSYVIKEQIVNIIIFSRDRNKVITSRYIKKVGQKLKYKTLLTLYFAGDFTIEAKKLINDSKGISFVIDDDIEWTEESLIRIRNGEL